MADDDGPRELPYLAEYAKSGRAGCKACKTTIEKSELRLAVMVQNRFADAKMPNWFHFTCFFEKVKPKSVGDIAHFEGLSIDDQEKIQKMIVKIPDKTRIQDFKVEYAKSSQAECVACTVKIAKEQVRIGKIDHESDISMRFGPIYRWHHVECFVKVREAIGFFDAADKIPNFVQLETEDRDLLRKQIAAIKPQKRKAEANGTTNGSAGAGSSKKMKTDLDNSQMKDQVRELFAIKSSIQKLFEDKSKKNHVTIKDLVRLLEKNGQEPPTPAGLQDVLERVSDILYFGPLEKCKTCGTGQLVYRSGIGYQCLGYMTDFAKCGAVNNDPERKKKLKIPEQLSEVPYFSKFKFVPKKRIVQAHAAPVEAQSKRENFVVLTKDPLKELKFYLCESNDDLEDKIETFGGIILNSKSKTAAAFVATKKYMKSEDKKLTFARANLIPVLDAEFINQISETCVPMDVLRKHLLSDWCGESLLIDHLKKNYPHFGQKKKSFREEKEKKYEKKMKNVKLTVKDGTVVDPDSKLSDAGHILKVGKLIYSCVLNRFSVEDNKNSYYKIQIIEADDRSSYHVFRSWGRIGTIIGDTKLKEFADKEDAIDNFNEVYHEKTMNQFGKNYVKVPGSYVPMEIDFSEGKKKKAPSSTVTSSKLDPGVQELISFIFDRANMIKTLAQFHLDTSKMPLGKLSRTQLLAGLSILKQAEDLIASDKDERYKKTMFNDLTNKFFTLCPQNFGVSKPPILNDLLIIKERDDMLENLLEIELAYEMLMTSESEGGSEIDANYAKLKCDLSVLDIDTEEYKAIKKYVQNTHAATHDNYKLDIEKVYIVNREDEKKRFEPFKKFTNRKLLWHGSRSTNFAGIFSHGLKIAPKEAPTTGYMFGKGIYFADMVSKSANYCHVNLDEDEDPDETESGILLLCEVALGNMWELKDAKYVEKLPEGKNSVKGIGMTYPSQKDVFILEDGIEVPYGKATKFLGDGGGSSLLYNEYIVYNKAQVNIRYAVKLKFKARR